MGDLFLIAAISIFPPRIIEGRAINILCMQGENIPYARRQINICVIRQFYLQPR